MVTVPVFSIVLSVFSVSVCGVSCPAAAGAANTETAARCTGMSSVFSSGTSVSAVADNGSSSISTAGSSAGVSSGMVSGSSSAASRRFSGAASGSSTAVSDIVSGSSSGMMVCISSGAGSVLGSGSSEMTASAGISDGFSRLTVSAAGKLSGSSAPSSSAWIPTVLKSTRVSDRPERSMILRGIFTMHFFI